MSLRINPDANNNATSGWPAATIANSVTAAKPELIVYTGDFFYREAPCPDNDGDKTYDEVCRGEPYGYNSTVNRADWFEPFRDMLTAASIVFSQEIMKPAQQRPGLVPLLGS